jgi:hypothetical protein
MYARRQWIDRALIKVRVRDREANGFQGPHDSSSGKEHGFLSRSLAPLLRATQKAQERGKELFNLSLADRQELSRGLVPGDSLRTIATRLGRAPRGSRGGGPGRLPRKAHVQRPPNLLSAKRSLDPQRALAAAVLPALGSVTAVREMPPEEGQHLKSIARNTHLAVLNPLSD